MARAQPVHKAHDGDCNETCFANGPHEAAVIRRNAVASGAQSENERGEWVPSIPLPLYVWPHLHRCCCERTFWTDAGYRGHYALRHILALR